MLALSPCHLVTLSFVSGHYPLCYLERIANYAASREQLHRAQVAAGRQRVATVGQAYDDRDIAPRFGGGPQRRQRDRHVERAHPLPIDKSAHYVVDRGGERALALRPPFRRERRRRGADRDERGIGEHHDLAVAERRQVREDAQPALVRDGEAERLVDGEEVVEV